MLNWYVMHSKPQKEPWLYDQLSTLEIETYYPYPMHSVMKGF
jgi:hypothetical protein